MPRIESPQPFERVDNTPVEIPTRLRLPQTRTDQMRAFIRQEMSRAAEENGMETFAEADDFDIDEEDAPLTPYELMDLEPPVQPEQTTPLQNGVQAAGQPAAVPPANSEVPSSVPPKAGSDGQK